MARNWSKEEELKWMEEEQREIENDSPGDLTLICVPANFGASSIVNIVIHFISVKHYRIEHNI